VAPEEKTADPLKQKLGRQLAYVALAQRGFKKTSFFLRYAQSFLSILFLMDPISLVAISGGGEGIFKY